MRRFRSGSGWPAVGLRRPEIIWTETMGRGRNDHGAGRADLAIHREDRDRPARQDRDGGGGAREDRDVAAGMREDRDAGRRGDVGDAGRDEHWSALDIFAMIIAAFRVLLPPMLAILAAAAAAYGLFMLAFG